MKPQTPDVRRLVRKIRCLTALIISCALTAHAVRAPQPTIRLSLADLGVPAVPQLMRSAGFSLLTVHFVDNAHLLVTYGTRDLVQRLPNDPPEHNDRAVAALLIEIPSGKVIARTRWHFHDYDRYLWALGNGRFLIRNQSRLVAIAPLANLSTPDPFRSTPFLRLPGKIDALLIDPEGTLVTAEISPIRRKLPRPGNLVAPPPDPTPDPEEEADAPKHRPTSEEFYFVRVAGTGSTEAPITAIAAGVVKTQGAGLIPISARGYLAASQKKRDTWAVNFESFSGESRKLAPLESSCPPLLQLISPTQYIAFSCRGAEDKITLSSFNFAPAETWEEPMPGTAPFGFFAFSPQSGRFALSRTISLATTANNSGMTLGNPASEASAQDLRVYQAESGDLLLKLTPTPISLNGQNFDFSPDGLSLLMVHEGAIEIYRLPPPSKKDIKELAELQQQEPPIPQNPRIEMGRNVRQAADKAAENASTLETEPPATPPAPAAPAAVASTPAASNQGSSVSTSAASAPTVSRAPENIGDVQEEHRKPPTLLNPGETLDNGKKPKPTTPQ